MTHELIAQYGLTVLEWLLAGLSLLLAKYVFVKIDNDIARGVTERLWGEVRTSTLEVGQVYVSELDLNSDGKISAEEKATAKKMALDKVKANLGKAGLAKLARIVGGDNIDDYIGGKIEAFLGGTKVAKLSSATVELPEKP